MQDLVIQNPAPAISTLQWANLVAGAVVGAAIGFLGARATAWRDRAIHRRKIAANLLEETRRIRDELGKSDVVVREGGRAKNEVPRIHPWMQSLVPEAALIHGDVVGDFLRLDRELQNLDALREWYIQALNDRDTMPSVYGAESEKAREAKLVAAEKRKGFSSGHAKVAALLDHIDQLLSPHAKSRRWLFKS